MWVQLYFWLQVHPEHNGVFCFDSHFDQDTHWYPQIKANYECLLHRDCPHSSNLIIKFIDLYIFAKVDNIWTVYVMICAWSFPAKLSSPFSTCCAIQSGTQIDCIWRLGILHVPDIDFPLSCNIPTAWQVVQNTKLMVTGRKSGNLTGSDDKCLTGPSHCLSENGATKSTKTNGIVIM